MKPQKVRIPDARKLAETLINECDPENLAEFLDKYLNDSDVGFVYKNGDDFLIAYMYSEDGEKLLDELLKNDSKDFSAYKNGEDFIKEMLEDKKEEEDFYRTFQEQEDSFYNKFLDDCEDEDKIKRRELPFPECFKFCSAVELLGVSECENVCPEKFKKENKDEGQNF